MARLFLIAADPFALLFGVMGTEAGLSIAQLMGFSVVVIAGAAQFTAVQLTTQEAPTLIVMAAALVVNLCLATYFAARAPHLGNAPIWQRLMIGYLNVDQTYALARADYDREPDQPTPRKLTGAVPPAPIFIWPKISRGVAIGCAIGPSDNGDGAGPPAGRIAQAIRNIS